VRCKKCQTTQSVLLEMPLELPRSFLTPSSGIFMKWYSLNQPISFAEKCDAIARIDSRGISLALIGCLKPQLALVHSFPLQVKFAHNLMGKSFGKTSEGLMLVFLMKNIPISFLSLAGPSALVPPFFAFLACWRPDGLLSSEILGVVGSRLSPRRCT